MLREFFNKNIWKYYFFAVSVVILLIIKNQFREISYIADNQRTGFFKTSILSNLFSQGTWKFKAKKGVVSSPVIETDTVYFGDLKGRLYALSRNTGKKKWIFDAEDEITFSPAVDEKKVYAASVDGNLYAVNKQNGEKIWQFTTDNNIPILSSPIIYKGELFFGDRNGVFYSIKKTSGSEIWRFQVGGGIDSTPLVVDNLVYFGSFDNYVYALEADSGKEKWRFETGGKVDSSAAYFNNTIFITSYDQNVYALDSKTGKQIWKFKADGIFIDTSPVVYKNSLFVGCYSGKVFSLDINTGKEIWRAQIGAPIVSSPAIDNNILYIGGHDYYLHAFDTNTGEEKWRFKTWGTINSVPAIANGIVYFGSNDQYFYAINAKNGKFKNNLLSLIGSKIDIKQNNQEIKKYDIYELTIRHKDSEYNNPWEDVDVSAVFTDPQGKNFFVSGFYYGTDSWKIRFSPPTIGDWKWEIIFSNPYETFKKQGSFYCNDSQRSGFIRISKNNPYLFVSDGGEPFHLLGISDTLLDYDPDGNMYPLDNFCIGVEPEDATSSQKPIRTDISEYLNIYGPLGAGFNLFRWSTNNASYKLWNSIDCEENKYSIQKGVWGDELVKSLHKNNMKIWITLFGFDPVYPEAEKNGDQLIALKKYIHYVVARYGAYTDIWELLNEADVTNQWTSVFARYLKSIDPYKHIITTSWEKPELPEIEINSPHWYEDESEFESDKRAWEETNRHKFYKKPVVFGEQGNKTINWDENSALRMRLRLWASFFAEGKFIIWNTSCAKDWKDNIPATIYLGSYERKYINIFQNFINNASDSAKTILIETNKNIRGYGSFWDKGIIAYFHHYTDHSTQTNTTLTINVPFSGKALWIDPATGDKISEYQVTTGNNNLKTPQFTIDIALKIIPDFAK